jgi:hypothetical protein
MRKGGTLPPENLPSLSDLFSRQTGISVGTRQPKWPRVEMASGRDWAIDRSVTALRPRTGGDGNTSLTRGFVGPTILTSHRSCRGHDGGVILVGHRGCGAIAQEGPSLVFSTGVLPLCARRYSLVYVTPTSPVFALILKGGAGVAGVAPHQPQSFNGLWCAQRHPCARPWWRRWLRAWVT